MAFKDFIPSGGIKGGEGDGFRDWIPATENPLNVTPKKAKSDVIDKVTPQKEPEVVEDDDDDFDFTTADGKTYKLKSKK